MRRPQARLGRSRRTSSRSRALLLALLLLLLLLALLQLLGSAPLGGPASAPASAPSCVQDRSTNALLPPSLRATSDAARGAHFAIISTWPPTKCGIATYSAGLREGLLSAGAHRVDVLAMHLRSNGLPPPAQYGPEVVLQISQDVPEHYELAAKHILQQRYTAVFLQHEYGIFGGYRGEFIIPLLRLSASVPVVTTLHTVESVPSPMVQHALAQVLRHSAAVVTLSPSGCRAVEGWSSTVGLPGSEGLCTSIHHGVPQLPLCLKGPLKKALGMSPATFLIMAGGLLSAPKGVEHILEALRSIGVSVPSILLLVAGEPHPVLGKAYLEELHARVSELGVEALVQFRSRYAPQAELERLYGAADVFICAHTSPEQTSSGTMLLAMAAGAVVVATPFAQAAELLTPGIGLLVPFQNASAISEAVIAIAREPRRAQRLRAAAYATMSSRAWPAVAARYAELALHPPRVTQAGAPRFELGGGASGALTFEGAEFVEAGNQALSLAVVRNVNWVDGVGPGWYPTDTFLSRRRPVWGLDSLLLNGCYMNYQALGGKTQTTSLRVLGDLDTSFKLLRPAGIEQGWAGAVGAASAHVSRRMVLLPSERDSFSLEVQASLSGAEEGAVAWLTTGFDQLSSNPGVQWDSVTAHDTAGVLSVHAACDWDGVSMAVSHLRVFAMHGRRVADGAATAVTVSMRSGAEGGVHTIFACTADRRLQYLAFDMPLQHGKDGMSARATADVRWT